MTHKATIIQHTASTCTINHTLCRPCYESAKNWRENANVFSTKAQM